MSIQIESYLGIPPSLLNQIKIDSRRNSGGYYIMQVPLEFVARDDIPLDHKWVQTLAKMMEEERRKNNGTGQIDPIQVGLPSGAQKFEILDGHHRDAANVVRGFDDICTFMPNCTWENVYDAKLANTERPQLVFARANLWIQKIWPYSGLSQEFTVEQAMEYYLGVNSSQFKDSDPEKLDKISKWVKHKSEVIWHKEVKTMYDCLLKARGVSPKVIGLVRGGQRGKTKVLTPTHAQNIGEVLANNPDEVQLAVAQMATEEGLSAFDIWELSRKVQNAKTAAEVETLAKNESKKELSVEEKRAKEIDELSQHIAEKIRQLAKQHPLTSINSPYQTTLLLSQDGPVAERIRRTIQPIKDEKRQPELTISEQHLLSIDFRSFRELINPENRQTYLAKMIELLGFDLNIDHVQGLYPTRREGIDWIKCAHPDKNIIALTYGKRNGDEFTPDGTHLIYSQAYNGVHKLQKESQAKIQASKPKNKESVIKKTTDEPTFDELEQIEQEERVIASNSKTEKNKNQPTMADLYPWAGELRYIQPQTRFISKVPGKNDLYFIQPTGNERDICAYAREAATGSIVKITLEELRENYLV